MEVKFRNEQFSMTIDNKGLDVLLTITVGNAQIGGSIVKWVDENTILKKGAIVNLNLGKGSEIIGKVLEITTNILDVNSQTNGVVTTNYFHNTKKLSKSFSDTLDNDGDVFSLTQTINFN